METGNLKNMVVYVTLVNAEIIGDEIKETEMIISHYMSKIENNKKKEILNKKINKKYNKMKKYLYITSFICIIEMILILIK